jgi:hypothetical protein
MEVKVVLFALQKHSHYIFFFNEMNVHGEMWWDDVTSKVRSPTGDALKLMRNIKTKININKQHQNKIIVACRELVLLK